MRICTDGASYWICHSVISLCEAALQINNIIKDLRCFIIMHDAFSLIACSKLGDCAMRVLKYHPLGDPKESSRQAI